MTVHNSFNSLSDNWLASSGNSFKCLYTLALSAAVLSYGLCVENQIKLFDLKNSFVMLIIIESYKIQLPLSTLGPVAKLTYEALLYMYSRGTNTISQKGSA